VNTAFVASLIQGIGSAQTCSDLLERQAAAESALNDLISSATAEMAVLTVLATAPTSGTLLSWAIAVAAHFADQVNSCSTLIGNCTTALAQLADAVSSAKSRLNCT
jgi:hypothetical protein